MLLYQIALINVFWCDNEINTRYFDSVETQRIYFENKTGGKFCPLSNFNMGNNVETSIIYRDDTSRSVEELLSCNYAVIQKIDNDTKEVINERYFFAQCSQDSGRQMRVVLNLDDIQTNYFKYKNDIKPCLIKRANLNRFIKVNDKYKFDNRISSKLFNDEPLTFPQVPTRRERIMLKYTNNIDIDTWIHNNVICWCYCFIDKSQTYKAYNSDGTSEMIIRTSLTYQNFLNSENLECEAGVVCFPILKSGSYLYDANGSQLNYKSLESFRFKNNNTSYFYNIKISMVAPFNEYLKATINGNIMTLTNNNNFETFRVSPSGDANLGIITNIAMTTASITSYDINLNMFEFTKEEVIGNYSNKLNPKINSSKLKTLRIGTANGQVYDYDLQKIGDDIIQLEYSETIQPEITKGYLRIKGSHGLYLDPTNKDFTGLILSCDNALPFANEVYAQFLASNKNFWQQSDLGIISNSLGSVINDAKNKNLVGLVGDFASVAIQDIQRGLSVDNIKNQPSTLTRASGNAMFNMQVNRLGVYIEILEAVDLDKQIFDDYMKQTGFILNIIDSITNYDNIRKYWNYVSAEVEIIDAPLSPLEEDRLREKLKNIRFWNIDNVDYSLNNYERGIDL